MNKWASKEELDGVSPERVVCCLISEARSAAWMIAFKWNQDIPGRYLIVRVPWCVPAKARYANMTQTSH